ncbi:hypothetical protein ACN28E_36505 [Archangium lansingense]|uniref:hypothetical protein n=1 Tax=Archangium lansingense TaxID=2995310 RepID=UPI003B800F7A
MAAPPPLPREPTDQIEVELHDDMLALTWSDTEERLQGSIHPAVPRAGTPLQLNLQVGSFEGEPFEGPLILTLREVGASHGQSLTVKKGAQHWQATFTPESDGLHLLDVSFRSTRHKALHATLQVQPSRVPLMIGWAVFGLGGLALLGYTVRGLLKGERAEERPLPSSDAEPVPPVDTPSAPATSTPETTQSATPGADAPPTSEPPAMPAPPSPAMETAASHETTATPADSSPSAPEAENKPASDL